MAASSTEKTDAPGKADFWSTDQYAQVASFVPKLTTKVVDMLAPRAEDTILDLGCGDGVLTAALAPHCKSIVGIDSSSSMIAALRAAHGDRVPAAFVLDCSKDLLPSVTSGATSSSVPASVPEALHAGHYTAVFSNAALHWIMRAEAGRAPFFDACYKLLKPGGRLVAECGGAGNVAEVHGAIVHELLFGQGVPEQQVKDADPWWFGSVTDYKALVEHAGLEWVRGESELRPTTLTEGEDGGAKGWVRFFATYFSNLCPGGEQGEAWATVVERVAKVIEYVGRRSDGSVELNYVRVRFEARKPAAAS